MTCPPHWITSLTEIRIEMAPPKTPNSPRGTIKGGSTQGIVSFTIRAAPLPPAILDFILDNALTLKRVLQGKLEATPTAQDDVYELDSADVLGDVVRKPTATPEQFWDALRDICQKAGGDWADVSDKIWAFGPQQIGGCLLIDARKSGGSQSSVVLVPICLF